jgi:hypothetical protein
MSGKPLSKKKKKVARNKKKAQRRHKRTTADSPMAALLRPWIDEIKAPAGANAPRTEFPLFESNKPTADKFLDDDLRFPWRHLDADVQSLCDSLFSKDGDMYKKAQEEGRELDLDLLLPFGMGVILTSFLDRHDTDTLLSPRMLDPEWRAKAEYFVRPVG